MQKVLRKRILRDLKSNLFRYLALSAMIILCMYIIISLIGTADTIISGSEEAAVRNRLEDGQFRVFVPLTESQKEEMEQMGLTVEEQFFLDFECEDGSIVRVFKVREQINLLEIVEGSNVSNASEIVLERRYAQEHALSSGSESDLLCNGHRRYGYVSASGIPGHFFLKCLRLQHLEEPGKSGGI